MLIFGLLYGIMYIRWSPRGGRREKESRVGSPPKEVVGWKANRAKQTQKTVAGSRLTNGCTNKPNSVGGRVSGTGGQGSGPPGNAWRRLPACAGMTFLQTGLLRQTNPIYRRAEGRIRAVRITSCAEWDAGEAVRKQSQFVGSRPGRPWYWDPKRDRSRLGRGPQRGSRRWGAQPTHGRDAHATECLAASPRPCLRRGDIPARG